LRIYWKNVRNTLAGEKAYGSSCREMLFTALENIVAPIEFGERREQNISKTKSTILRSSHTLFLNIL